MPLGIFLIFSARKFGAELRDGHAKMLRLPLAIYFAIAVFLVSATVSALMLATGVLASHMLPRGIGRLLAFAYAALAVYVMVTHARFLQASAESDDAHSSSARQRLTLFMILMSFGVIALLLWIGLNLA